MSLSSTNTSIKSPWSSSKGWWIRTGVICHVTQRPLVGPILLGRSNQHHRAFDNTWTIERRCREQALEQRRSGPSSSYKAPRTPKFICYAMFEEGISSTLKRMTKIWLGRTSVGAFSGVWRSPSYWIRQPYKATLLRKAIRTWCPS